MRSRPVRGGMMRAPLTPAQVARLRRPVIGRGGMQDLLRRMQAHLLPTSVDLYLSDLPRIARYYAYDRGGFQSRLPVEALRPWLPATAPLFADADAAPAEWWIYFRREVMGDPRIKIGQTGNPHGKRLHRYSTDNPRRLETLLLLAPVPDVTDHTYHRRFAHLRADRQDRDGEWFWPGEDLLAFIYAAVDAQRTA